MRKGSCNGLSRITHPLHFGFPVIPACEIRKNSGKIASTGAMCLTSESTDPFQNLMKEMGPLP